MLQSRLDKKNEWKESNSDNLVVGSDMWLLNETRGNTLFDRTVLNSIKLTYTCIRVIFQLLLGKERRDKLWLDRKINFQGFLYKLVERLGLENRAMLVFWTSKHKFKFCSRVTKKINNFLIHDVFTSMTSHEEDILEYFTPKEGDVVIDIGAAFGFYTILASRMVNNKGRIISIEPQSETFQMLNTNIKLNKLSNVITLNCAIYSIETKLKLYSSYSIFPQRMGKEFSDFIEVEAHSLDNLILEYGKIEEVNWIKIDVEGAEYEVLKGAHNILSKCKDIVLLIEIHNFHNLEQTSNHYQSIIDLLKRYNFKIEFEKIYQNGERHVIVRKQNRFD